MSILPEFIERPLRHRSLLLRPSILRELTGIAENEATFGNAFEVFLSGDALYERMVADIGRARLRVLLDMYMFLSDGSGWLVAEALMAKAREGVEVRLIYDSLGSMDADPAIFAEMAAAGVRVLEYRPLKPWKHRFGIFGRDHRKILVVDGRTGYLGGMNVGDFWSETRSLGGAWRDTHVRIEGDAAADLTVLFAETWHRETGEVLSLDGATVRSGRRRPLRDGDDLPGGALIVGGRGRYRRRIRRLFLLEIRRARNRLLLTNPYLVPDRAIRSALCRAAARGVEVILVLPERSDVKLADLAGRRDFSRYLRHGIRVYLYQKTILHAKSMVVDGAWAMVGSANLDSQSLNHNLEANAVVLDVEAARVLEGQFWRDVEGSREVDAVSWRRRSWKSKLYEWLASWLRPWL